MSAPPPPVKAPSRWKIRLAIGVAAACLAAALAGEGILLWRDRRGGALSARQAREKAVAYERMKGVFENWSTERAKLDFQREELSQWVEQAGARLLELEAERTLLLDRMKSLLKERNGARAQADRLQEELDASRAQQAQLAQEMQRQRPPAPVKPSEDYDALLKRQKEQSFAQMEKERQESRAKLNLVEAQLTKAQASLKESRRKHAQAQAETVSQAGRSEAHWKKRLKQVEREAARRETDLKVKLQEAQRWFSQMQAELQRKLKEAQAQAAKGEAHKRSVLERWEKERLGLEQVRSNLIQDWTRLYVRVGVLETENGNFSKAEQAFRQAIQLSPSLGEAHYNLGILYDDYMHNRPAAILEYEQYLLVSAQAKDAKMVRGWLDLLQADHLSRSRRDQWNRPGTHGFAKTLKQLLD